MKLFLQTREKLKFWKLHRKCSSGNAGRDIVELRRQLFNRKLHNICRTDDEFFFWTQSAEQQRHVRRKPSVKHNKTAAAPSLSTHLTLLLIFACRFMFAICFIVTRDGSNYGSAQLQHLRGFLSVFLCWAFWLFPFSHPFSWQARLPLSSENWLEKKQLSISLVQSGLV